MTAEALDAVRTIALALPETNERLSHGAPTFFIRDRKTFVMFVDNHHDVDVDWDEITEIVEDAYRCVAPKKLIAELDGLR